MSDSRAPDVVPSSDPVVPESEVHRRFLDRLHEIGAVLWEMDARTWRFTFVSDRAERLFGYPVALWYEEPDFWQSRLLHPDDRDWCVDFCTVASSQCRDHAFLYRARRADGSTIWVKDVVHVIADLTGAPVVMRGLMVDATEEIGQRPPRQMALDFEAPELERYREILVA